MGGTGNTTIHNGLHHCHGPRTENLIYTPAAYTAWANELRNAMPPTTVDEDLLQPFKAERGASKGAVLNPTTWLAFFGILLVALSCPDERMDSILLPGLPGKLI